MNSSKRARLNEAAIILGEVNEIINGVLYQEQDSLENYPENLQATERFEAMESAVENLHDAIESVDEAKAYICAAVV